MKVVEGVLHCVPPVGHMMWGKLPGYDWWPGCIISHNEVKEEKKMESRDAEKENKVWIKWYGETQLSQVSSKFLSMCMWNVIYGMVYRYWLRSWLLLKASRRTTTL